jgi:hypothetical protein
MYASAPSIEHLLQKSIDPATSGWTILLFTIRPPRAGLKSRVAATEGFLRRVVYAAKFVGTGRATNQAKPTTVALRLIASRQVELSSLCSGRVRLSQLWSSLARRKYPPHPQRNILSTCFEQT